MPNGSGFDLLRELQAQHGGRLEIPVVAATAHARPEDAAAALSAGFSAYLTKPIDVRQMIDALGVAAGRA